MPYIPQEAREELLERPPETPGELNYEITQLVQSYLDTKDEIGYSALAEVVSALECAKLEFYRRVVVPYEDSKIEQNGDVYE